MTISPPSAIYIFDHPEPLALPAVSVHIFQFLEKGVENVRVYFMSPIR